MLSQLFIFHKFKNFTFDYEIRMPSTNFPAWPAVSKPTLFRQRIPLTNFLAWPGQSSVQPMFVEKSALPILPDEPAAAWSQP